MFQPKTFLDLAFAMKTGAEVSIGETQGTISSIEREDGSGRNWNVTMSVREIDPSYINGLGPVVREMWVNVDKKVFFREFN